jgi:hypothetical protein
MNEKNLKHGCVKQPHDPRDIKYEEVMKVSVPFNWQVGFDIEKKLGITLPIKDQDQSDSCVGQGWSYYAAIVNMVILGVYDEISAKAIYSKIFQSSGGADIRSGGLLTTTFGEVLEKIVSSHRPNGLVDEAWMEDRAWITPAIKMMAKNLQTKSIASINSLTMEAWAQAIRDNNGVVAGVEGCDNGTWLSNEPKPPLLTTPQNELWGHCLFFGKAGIDKLGKYISTPQSWGNVIPKDKLHLDGWQKLRQNWFDNNGRFLFNAWSLINKIIRPMNAKLLKDSKSPSCGYWIPATSEQDLIKQANNLGIILPTLSNGTINWGEIKLDGNAALN